MTRTGFTVRLVAVLLGAVLLAALATVGHWVHEHHRRLQRAEESYAGYVLTELKAALEARLNLGLALQEVPQVDSLLELARGDAAGILSVAVVDETGTTIFSTDAVEIGERAPAVMADHPPGTVWSAVDDVARVYGLDLTTSFDTLAGTVVLRLPVGTIATRVQDFALVLVLRSVAVATAVGAAAAVVLGLMLRRTQGAVEAVADALDSVARPEIARPQASAGSGADPLGLPVRSFETAIRARHGLLGDAERELLRLDETA